MKEDLEKSELYKRGYKDGYEEKKKQKRAAKRNSKLSKKKARWRTSFMVFAYAGILFLCLLLQTFVYLGVQYGWAWAHYFNSAFTLPIDNMTFIWTIICSAYIGVDRAAYCVRSAEMIAGESDIGNPGVLRTVIVLSVLFFFIAVACNIFVNANYDLVTLSTCVGTSMSLYITGQKALTLCKNVDGKKKQPQDSEVVEK